MYFYSFLGFILKHEITGIKFTLRTPPAGYRADYFQSIALAGGKSGGTTGIIYLFPLIAYAVGGCIVAGNL